MFSPSSKSKSKKSSSSRNNNSKALTYQSQRMKDMLDSGVEDNGGGGSVQGLMGMSPPSSPAPKSGGGKKPSVFGGGGSLKTSDTTEEDEEMAMERNLSSMPALIERSTRSSEFGLPTYNDNSEFDDEDDDASTNSSRLDSTEKGGNGRSNSNEIAAKENTQVKYTKVLVFVVLICAAAAVGFFTWWYISQEESEDYQQQFQRDAKELMDVSNANGRNILAVLNIFATLLSSNAKQSGASWPMVTLPDFEKFGTQSRELSGALLLAFTPRVRGQENRTQWEEYSFDNQWWIRDGLVDLGYEPDVRIRNITDFIYRKTTRSFLPEVEFPAYSPVWQMSPSPRDTSVVNFNLFNHPTFKRLVEFSDFTREAAISEVLDTFLVFGTSAPQKGDDPQSIAVLPVFDEPQDKSSEIVGHVVAVIPWGQFFKGILQDGHNGIHVVLEESCGNAFTYILNGANATFLGVGDLHDTRYTSEGRSTEFVAYDGDLSGLDGGTDHCQYTISVYPSEVYESDYESNDPWLFALIVVLVFVFTSMVFVIYDCTVTRRQQKVNQVAVQSTAIVSSLFPAQVRDKLMHEQQQQEASKQKKTAGFQGKGNVSSAAARAGMGGSVAPGGGGDGFSVMDGGGGTVVNGDDPTIGSGSDKHHHHSPPIADLFPSATVLFMDIAGFTAWSSQREPAQVFMLLETIYASFDKLAKQRKVFKVETIGDCYVAVCGLPEPNEHHATTMARFTRDCLGKMNELVNELETTLGPDTAELAMRAGLHSGPVTAGVLRGERARFQLFGDTVNTAARMESTGVKNKIQISQETAELLCGNGKSNWVKAREEVVHAKGKGELSTFWLLPKGGAARSMFNGSVVAPSERDARSEGTSPSSEGDLEEFASMEAAAAAEQARIDRLVEFTVDLLIQPLKKICAKRGVAGRTEEEDRNICALETELGQNGICLDEVVEVIELPEFDSAAYNEKHVKLSAVIKSQLHDLVKMIASMYKSNPFHNFDHAAHVTQSVSKLLSRIVAVKHIGKAEQLHDHTYGITSDPLTQFTIIFSSLIHDVDHSGVPNFLLVKEDPELGAHYKNQAVAEQNSVDVTWNLFMDPSFKELRAAIYSTEDELRRFRQLIVNSLMATDIFDKQLSTLRKKRWEEAFSDDHHEDEDPQVTINRKATIVIEHIIQASDVSHTMQHWHVYSKWNAKLYREVLKAHQCGRSDKDPTPGWFAGELWFFDNYVIPLAHKLKQCGVFGVSSDEYLQYALANRREWEAKGNSIVQENQKRANMWLEEEKEREGVAQMNLTSDHSDRSNGSNSVSAVDVWTNNSSLTSSSPPTKKKKNGYDSDSSVESNHSC